MKYGSFQVKTPKWKFWTAGWWVHVVEKEEGTWIYWTSNENSHHRDYGKASGILIDKDENPIVFYEQGFLFPWLVWGNGKGTEEDRERAVKLIELAKKTIDEAQKYDRNTYTRL